MPMLHLKGYHCKKSRALTLQPKKKRQKYMFKKKTYLFLPQQAAFSLVDDFLLAPRKRAKELEDNPTRPWGNTSPTTRQQEAGKLGQMLLQWSWNTSVLFLLLGGEIEMMFIRMVLHATGTCGSSQCIAKSYRAFSRIIYFNAWEAPLLCSHMIKPCKSVKKTPLPETPLLFPCNS